MSEKNVWDLHLKAALILVRNLRASAIKQGLDSRAVRVAICYLKHCDDHFAKKNLSVAEDISLKKLAWTMFQELKKAETS